MFGKILGKKIFDSRTSASMWKYNLNENEKALCAFSADSKSLIIVSYGMIHREVPFDGCP